MGRSVRHISLAGLCGVATAFLTFAALAGEAEIVEVELKRLAPREFRVSVTIRHGDEGWDHYADRWVVLSEDGSVLGERVLAHPHVEEQPFTRSLTLSLPTGTARVRVRPRDSVHGEGAVSDWIAVPD